MVHSVPRDNTPQPMSDAPDRVRDLFDRALEHAPQTRDQFLKTECGDNTSLFDEVRGLLHAYESVETVETPSVVDPLVRQRFGAYEAVRVIGAGGMGRVYLGRRADGAFSREVAIKIIDATFQTDDLVARFEQERRILGSLQHPYIAQLFDAGTQGGRLYFVMEYVDGLPITQFCTRQRLALRERIELFSHVCEAVAEANRNLVIHRDLKPGNILVDSSGRPKLLDFGIAKPLTRAGLEVGHPTEPMLKRGTPAYASPEQLQGGPAHTGMDVFSLGVVLHEIVTGHRPWLVEADDVTGTGAGRFVSPSLGMQRALEQNGSGESAASNDASAVRPQDVEGDLDAIILKTLHDDTSYRYGSVEGVLADLQAYLASYPVGARPITRSIRVARFVRRNPTFTALASIALVASLVATLAMWRIWSVAARDRDAARAQLQNLKTLAAATFAIDETLADLPGATAPRRQLVEALRAYLSRVDVNEDRTIALEIAEGYRRLGDIQGNPNGPNLGDPAAALRSYESARALLEPTIKASDNTSVRVALAHVETSIGDVLLAQHSLAPAQQSYERALSLLDNLGAGATNDPSVQRVRAGIHRPLGDLKRTMGDVTAALSEYDKALAIDLANMKRFPQEPDYKRLLALSLLRIAGAHASQGATTEARRGFEQAAAILGELGHDRGERVGVRREAAFGRARLGMMLEAEGNTTGRAEIRAALDDFRALSKADPADARSRRDLMATLVQLGDVLRVDEETAARDAYRQARELALALAAGQADDSPAAHDVALTNRRLTDLAARIGVTDLKLFRVVGGRRVLMLSGDPAPPLKAQIAAKAIATPNWSRYLLVFGAEGPARLFDESELAKSGWVVPATGPAPAQTIILLAVPRALSDDERHRLVADVNSIEGPRTVDWDSQIVWSSAVETIESTSTARGGNAPWIAAIRERIDKLGRIAVAGRTFPLAPDGQD